MTSSTGFPTLPMSSQGLIGDYIMPMSHLTDSPLFRYAFNTTKLDSLTQETMLRNLWAAAAYSMPMVSLKSPQNAQMNQSVIQGIDIKLLRNPKLRDVKTAFSGRCPSCDKVYKSKKDLQDHIIIHHERKYECERCTRTFVSEKRMKTHQIKKHSVLSMKKSKCEVKRKLYQCEQCGRTYETYYNFKEHLAKHDGKLFECSVCNKQLSGQSALSRHSKIHDKPHECMMCSGRFSSAYDLDCHFSYYHSAIKRFKCEHCERVLYNYSGKLRHERLCAARPQSSTAAKNHQVSLVNPSIPVVKVEYAAEKSDSGVNSLSSNPVVKVEYAAEKSDPRVDCSDNGPDSTAERSDLPSDIVKVEESKEKIKKFRSTFHIRDILCDIPEFRNEHLKKESVIVS